MAIITMANFVFIAASIDGFIARKDGSIDWLNEIENSGKNDFGYNDFIKKIDAIIMGKNTFNTLLSFPEWPYSIPVFVLSSSLEKIPPTLENAVSIVKGDLRQIISDLAAKNLYSIYIDGGKTIQSFLREDLIDEMIISTIPVILGDGIPLFDKVNIELKYKLSENKNYQNILSQNIYNRIR